jgi:hypothetical protein
VVKVGLTQSDYTLPKDPGPDNDKTLEGIDANNNGIRDDVDREIFFLAPGSAKRRAALQQFARSLGKKLISLNGEQSILKNQEADIFTALHCVYAFYLSDAAGDVTGLLTKMYNNTTDRSNMDALVNRKAGSILTPIDQGKKDCTYNPDSLPN